MSPSIKETVERLRALQVMGSANAIVVISDAAALIERLAGALEEIIADADGHNLLKQRQSKHDDVLTWVSVARARRALSGEPTP